VETFDFRALLLAPAMAPASVEVCLHEDGLTRTHDNSAVQPFSAQSGYVAVLRMHWRRELMRNSCMYVTHWDVSVFSFGNGNAPLVNFVVTNSKSRAFSLSCLIHGRVSCSFASGSRYFETLCRSSRAITMTNTDPMEREPTPRSDVMPPPNTPGPFSRETPKRNDRVSMGPAPVCS